MGKLTLKQYRMLLNLVILAGRLRHSTQDIHLSVTTPQRLKDEAEGLYNKLVDFMEEVAD